MNIKTLQSIMTDAMNHFNAEALCYVLLVTIYWKRRVPGALGLAYMATPKFSVLIFPTKKNHIFNFGLTRFYCHSDILLSQIRICSNL